MNLSIETNNSESVLTFTGPLDGNISLPEEERARGLIEPGAKLIYDMKGVTSLTSGGLRWVRLFYRQAGAVGCRVSVTGLKQEWLDVFDATGFLTLPRVRRGQHAASPDPDRRLAEQRTDLTPTHFHEGHALVPGRVLPFGAWPVRGGINFSVFSHGATGCTLVLYLPGGVEPLAEIPFPEEFRVGHVFTMAVMDLDPELIEYGFRMDGPYDPRNGHRFDPTRVLLDPYARAVAGRDVWGVLPNPNNPASFRGRLTAHDFEWEGDRPLGLPFENLVVYEMHVRGFTRDPSSGVKQPGTYAGLREKIPYLKELGVNAVELLPIFEFDEWENSRVHPQTGERLWNYWGYSTLGFWAPKAGYAATGAFGMQVDEFKTLVKELHRAGIEVILDVVFNHTAEGNENGPTLSFRGIDNRTYYMLAPDGGYMNFSGCGNTLNCNNPSVRDFVLQCLRYWVAEFHIDGFRFDLASILGRDPFGGPMANPPLVEALALDPVLGKTKLIAEAWDAGGLYQVGSFPSYGRWAEWNGKYRDCVRRFLKGDPGRIDEMSRRLLGSPAMYAGRGSTASINFITCHDGFTLWDMVSYNDKHNEANGENNNDGTNDNASWNSGVEGPTDDPGILAFRRRQVKNALAMLLLSQGVPMILMGDEVGKTQHGNNNTYCHDNTLNWFDWSLVEKNADLFRFSKLMIALRQRHPALRFAEHAGTAAPDGGFLEATWHGVVPWQADWSPGSRTLAFMLRYYKDGTEDVLYAAFNMFWETLSFGLPDAPPGTAWHVAVNTAAPSPQDVWEPDQSPPLEDQRYVLVTDRSVMVLEAKGLNGQPGTRIITESGLF